MRDQCCCYRGTTQQPFIRRISRVKLEDSCGFLRVKRYGSAAFALGRSAVAPRVAPHETTSVTTVSNEDLSRYSPRCQSGPIGNSNTSGLAFHQSNLIKRLLLTAALKLGAGLRLCILTSLFFNTAAFFFQCKHYFCSS